jgi:hypothetical protein
MTDWNCGTPGRVLDVYALLLRRPVGPVPVVELPTGYLDSAVSAPLRRLRIVGRSWHRLVVGVWATAVQACGMRLIVHPAPALAARFQVPSEALNIGPADRETAARRVAGTRRRTGVVQRVRLSGQAHYAARKPASASRSAAANTGSDGDESKDEVRGDHFGHLRVRLRPARAGQLRPRGRFWDLPWWRSLRTGGGRDRDQNIGHTIRTESEDFAKQVGLRIAEREALTRLDCGNIGKPTSRRCARTTPGRSGGACGRGRCLSSSGTLPSTRSTMRGRWRTRTFGFLLNRRYGLRHREDVLDAKSGP